MREDDGFWHEFKVTPSAEPIWTLKCPPLFSVEMTRGPLPGSGVYGKFWRASVNGHQVAHGDLEKAKAKVDWLIWNDIHCVADAYKRIKERVKAPGFKYDGSW